MSLLLKFEDVHFYSIYMFLDIKYNLIKTNSNGSSVHNVLFCIFCVVGVNDLHGKLIEARS